MPKNDDRGKGRTHLPSLVSSSELVVSRVLPKLDARTFVVIGITTYVGISAHALLIPIFWLAGQPLLAAINIGSVMAWVLARVMNSRHHHAMAAVLVSVEVVIHSAVCVALLGWGSGFQYYLIPLISFIVFYSRGSVPVVSSAALSVLATLVALFLLYEQGGDVLPAPFSRVLEIVNLVVPVLTVALLSFFYRQASIVAEVTMERLATEDPLTGLLNRRRMGERLLQERARTDRGADSFVIVMADIDLFKAVNDSFGHECGDDVLVEISRRLSLGLRSPDIVSRWGGEEFLMLLPDTEMQAASQVTERLRQTICELPIESRGREISVSMSFGISAYHSGMPLKDAIRGADEALYSAKAAGRNRVALDHKSCEALS